MIDKHIQILIESPFSCEECPHSNVVLDPYGTGDNWHKAFECSLNECPFKESYNALYDELDDVNGKISIQEDIGNDPIGLYEQSKCLESVLDEYSSYEWANF